jgi:outer membrane protein assembly factor BamB
MKTILALGLTCAAFSHAQIGRTFDWHTAAGDAQRTGWEKSDTKFTKEGVRDFSLVLKYKLEGPQKGSTYLLPPVVLGTLIGYRGFKELAFVANGSGDVWAIDVDLDRVYWQRHIDLPKIKKAKPTATCPLGITSEPTMEPGATFGGRRRKGASSSSQDFYRKIFAPRTLYLLASDGKLYRLDTSTGKDMTPPVSVMPPGANVSNLNAAEGEIYAATSYGCGGVPNAVWAIDVSGEKPKVTSFPSPAPEGFLGRNGVLLGSDDDVYAETSNTLQVLSPKDLKPQQTFSGALGETSPVAFNYKDRDVIVTVGKDGGLYLFDTKALNLPLNQTPPISPKGDRGVGGLATWESAEGTRWVLASLSGEKGAIVAFQLTEEDGKPVLKQAWTSHEIAMPETPVIANGVVFALSAGEPKLKGKEKGQPGGHAILYGLDAETGKEIYSTGDQVTAPANLSGVTMANGRVFFSTTDGTLYAFGYHLEH